MSKNTGLCLIDHKQKTKRKPLGGRRAYSSTTRGAFTITCAIGNWNTRNKSENIGEITAAKHAQFTRTHHTTFVEHDRAHIDATDHKPRQTRNNNNLPHNRAPSPDLHACTMLSHSTETKKQARNATRGRAERAVLMPTRTSGHPAPCMWAARGLQSSDARG